VNAKRLTIALMVALAVSGLFTFWLSRRVAKANHAALPSKRLYVAASKDLSVGEVLKPGSLRMVEWPVSVPIAGGFTKISAVDGRALLYPLAQGEPILARDLAAEGAGVGLTANIPSGMRAISVRSDEIVGVAGFLLPGTHVDVLVTYHSAGAPEPETATVLQDIEVLAAGQQIHPDPEGKPTSVDVVTLLLKPDDAEKVALATSLGAIHFVLRNGSDHAQVSDPPPVGLDQLTGVAAPPRKHEAVRAKPAQPESQHYEVVTILGNRQVVSSFN
jgi:pilus assembly protein CpaB